MHYLRLVAQKLEEEVRKGTLMFLGFTLGGSVGLFNKKRAEIQVFIVFYMVFVATKQG